MKLIAKKKRVQLTFKRLGICSLLVCLMLAATGCQEGNSIDNTDICSFMDQIATDTEKCIATRNTTLARDIWSKLTEYSLLAEQGNDEAAELAKAIGGIAATYESLVGYCESGDSEKLDKFLADFQKEASALASLLKTEGFDVSQLEKRIGEIVGK